MLTYGFILLTLARTRAAALRSEEYRERGASAIEWAIIAAITVIAASIIGAVVYNIVSDKSTQLNNCRNAALGSSCTP